MYYIGLTSNADKIAFLEATLAMTKQERKKGPTASVLSTELQNVYDNLVQPARMYYIGLTSNADKIAFLEATLATAKQERKQERKKGVCFVCFIYDMICL